MRAAFLVAIALACSSAHAQMHKCIVDGKVEYRQSPCEDTKQSRGMTGGTASGIDAMPTRDVKRADHAAPDAGPAVTVIGGERRGVPTERDIKNLETAASSRTLSQKEKQFLQDELRRAKLARETGIAYSDKDKRELDDLRSSQNRVDPKDRERARQQAEDIHMRAGEAVRGDVTATRQAEQDRVAARRQAAAIQQQKDAAAEAARTSGPSYDRIAQCIAGVCQGRSGETYSPVPGTTDQFRRGDGKSCSRGSTGELTCW